MKFLKLLICNIAIVTSLCVSGNVWADECYDPNYGTYYYCGDENYIDPLIAGAVISAIAYGAYNNNGRYYRHHHWHGGGWNGNNGWRH